MTSATTSDAGSSPFKCIADSCKKMYRLMFRSHLENAGKRQSPIDIKTEKCTFDKEKCEAGNVQLKSFAGDFLEMTLMPTMWKAVTVAEPRTSNLKNKLGETEIKKENSALTASHLPGSYKIWQFHAHWASTSDCGSEHTVDGKHYGGEVHFVFWNTKYGTAEVAACQPDGLAVLAVFLSEGQTNKDFQPVVDLVQLAKQGKKAEFSKDFEIGKLIPIGTEYFTYEGSLTTAPFSESVIWTVMMKPMEISKIQFDVFRKVCPKNYRECQPLNSRKVFSSMEFNIA